MHALVCGHAWRGACRLATILIEKSSVYAQTKIVCGVCVRDANGKWLDGVCVCVCVCAWVDGITRTDVWVGNAAHY